MAEELTGEQIKHMVDRFLRWPLPANFRPDAGISFVPNMNIGTPYEMANRPWGTNLFSADQAEAMVRFMIDGMPRAYDSKELVERLRELLERAHHVLPRPYVNLHQQIRDLLSSLPTTVSGEGE